MDNNNFSLSDIAAATGANAGFGSNNSWFVIIILLFLMMGGTWGGRGDYGQFATAASQQEILFGQQFQALDNKMDRLGNGIADATFALNNAVTTEGRNIQSQIANCCCETQRNTDSLRFDMANYNAGILAAIGADGEKTRAMIQANKIESLQEKIRSLELNQAMCGVVRYPNQMAYNAGTSPFCGCNCNCGTNI